jgi:tripartite-type tricarboxylate transporter receptor subunit TctC
MSGGEVALRKEMDVRPKKRMIQVKFLPKKTIGLLLALSIVLPASDSIAASIPYPTKPVRFIIPLSPGGSNDIIGRLVAAKLSERLGKNLVPENRGGAGGTLGTEMVARAEPDGYTLLLGSVATVINYLFYHKPYDPVRSFAPVAKIGSGSYVLTVHPGVPANSLKELIALAKKQPGKLIWSAGGSGSFMHVSVELFRMMAGIDFKVVQFKGGGPAMIDTMGGHSQILLTSVASALPQIKSGKLRALGLAGPVRSQLLPDVPTVSEAGVPGYEAIIWWGILAPAGTPKGIVDRLYNELIPIVGTEDTKKAFEGQGAAAELLGPAPFAKFIEAETAKWEKVVREGNIKGEE